VGDVTETGSLVIFNLLPPPYGPFEERLVLPNSPSNVRKRRREKSQTLRLSARSDNEFSQNVEKNEETSIVLSPFRRSARSVPQRQETAFA
jgi:hypothetical protein